MSDITFTGLNQGVTPVPPPPPTPLLAATVVFYLNWKKTDFNAANVNVEHWDETGKLVDQQTVPNKGFATITRKAHALRLTITDGFIRSTAV